MAWTVGQPLTAQPSTDSKRTSSGEIMATTAQEPSCEELRAMWRFSKRQSRASEITNEIPTYRDPFKFNVWQPMYYRDRTRSGSIGSGRRMRYRYNGGYIGPFSGMAGSTYAALRRPVYGRIMLKEPLFGPDGEQVNDGSSGAPRRRTQFRSGSKVGTISTAPGFATMNQPQSTGNFATTSTSGDRTMIPQKGRFDMLKEIIWNERAQELANQRRLQEMAARAEILRDIANGGQPNNFLDDNDRQNGKDIDVVQANSAAAIPPATLNRGYYRNSPLDQQQNEPLPFPNILDRRHQRSDFTKVDGKRKGAEVRQTTTTESPDEIEDSSEEQLEPIALPKLSHFRERERALR